MPKHVRSLLWQRFDLPGGDYCSLWQLDDGWRLSGVAVTSFDGVPQRADYTVECDTSWRSREATLLVASEGSERRLHVCADGAGGWLLDGQTVDGVRGLPDIDLGVTPATNTLSLRRLDLAIGASTEVVAAWVRHPELVMEPLRQCYTRWPPTATATRAMAVSRRS